MLQIRVAMPNELEHIIDFYNTIIDSMQGKTNKAGWKKGIYPTESFLRDAIAKGELYVGELENKMVVCVVANHEGNEGYRQVRWLVEAKETEQLVLHILGVHPMYVGRGIAQKTLQFIIQSASLAKIKSIRLDVLHDNFPAQRTYERAGFQHLDTITMYYDDTGWTDFLIYEYIV